MDEFELAMEYGETKDYDEQYADDFDALNDFEDDTPFVKRVSKSESAVYQKDRNIILKEEPFSKVSSNVNYSIEEVNEEDFLESLGPANPKPKKQKIQEDLEDSCYEQIASEEKKLPETERLQTASRKHVYRCPQLGKDCVTVTDSEGRRAYLAVSKIFNENHNEVKPKISKCNLLSMPIEDLIQTVEEKRHNEVMNKVNNLRNLVNGNIDEDGMIDESDVTDFSTEKDEPETSLWVEKFNPKRFTELLSDDGINRILLKWMKLWDEFVFGKSKKKVKTGVKQNEKTNLNENQKKFGKRKQNWDYEEEMDLDHTGRPKYKIALLAGNPGLGKTTLAHIVAKHAGYNPVEMNASDDRSAEMFRNTLEVATQMKCCMGEEKRPNCLIIDEIDGAPTQAINILLQAVKDTEESTKKKKQSSKVTVTRPIICICNDLYVPALRQLRQTALTLSVPQISPARLAQRLLEISRKQKMNADMGCLLALCDKSENDIRSCVNTLQFIFKKHGELKANHLQDVSVGQKDFRKGLFFILKSIFQLPKPSRKNFGFSQQISKSGLAQNYLAPAGMRSDLGTSVMPNSSSIRFHNILHLASSNSEFEKMSQGLFDNYLNVKSKDPHLDTVVDCTSWLQFGDRIETKIRSEQSYSLMKFYPFLPVAFHMQLAGPFAPKLSYSNSAVELHSRLSRSKQTWEALISDVKPSVKRNVGNVSAILDLFPFVYEIMHPTLRPVNIQLFSPSEKQQLLNLILTMISYNLNYQQERNSDGQYTYVLHPNIGDIISFPNLPQRKQLSYTAKQLIQREIDLEKMRKIEVSLQQLEIGNEEKSRKGKTKQVRGTDKLQPIAVKQTKSKPVLDFFGREVVQAKDSGRKGETKSSVINTQIWYKFNEGYSNAVRRTVRIKDFF